jgi:hypothetical protein
MRFARLLSVFRFRLRTLLLGVLGISIALGLYVASVRRQQAAVRALRAAGCGITYDYEFQRPAPYDPPGPAWLEPLEDDWFSSVTDVESPDAPPIPPFTDEQGEHLRYLPAIQSLWLGESHISDRTMTVISGLQRLRYLELEETNITDAGLAQLRRLTRLEHLDLSKTPITDLGVVHLSHLTELKVLRLDGTHISDDGLRHLGHMPRLETLDLSSTVGFTVAD